MNHNTAVHKSIYFLDSAVEDKDTLVSGFPTGTEFVLIDAERNGLGQIADYLDQRSNIDALHIISHGADGILYLGNSIVDADALERSCGQLARIGASLSETGDILLYGCQVAKSEIGEDFIAALAEATCANVAASRTLTGSADLGGDWELDAMVGAVQASIGISSSSRDRYAGVLGTFKFNIVSGNGTSTLTETAAISGTDFTLSATNSIGGDMWVSSGFLTPENLAEADTYTLTFDKAISISKFDLGEFTELSSGAYYVFTPNSGTAVKIADNSGSIVGAIATLNPSDWNAVTSITVSYEGNSGSLWRVGIDNIQFTSSNNVPTVTNAPSDITITEDTESNFDLSDVAFADADSGDTLTVTLTASAGTFSNPADSTPNVTATKVNATTITLAGTPDAINTYLDTVSNIKYTGASDASGNNAATITISAVDSKSGSLASNKVVNLDITNVNDAPVLDNTQSPSLTSIAQNAGDDDGSGADGDDDASNNSNNAGTSIADMVVNGSITDPDGSAVKAIAITHVDNTNGVWQYSTDNGTSWDNFSATTGSVVDISASARLLDGTLNAASTQLIRFVPDTDYSGTTNITFRAWDKSAGVAGGTADTSANGGSTSFSSASDTASITIHHVNQPPVLSSVNGENASRISAGGGAQNVTDLDDATLTNPDSTNYSGGNLTLTQQSGTTNGIWGVDGTTVTSGGDASIAAGETISIGGNLIGTVNATNDGQSGRGLEINFYTADATSANIQTLIRALTYEAPSTLGSRGFVLTINDGDGTANGGDQDVAASFSLTVTSEAPVVNNLDGDSVSMTSGGTIAIDKGSNVTVTDADAAHFDGGKLTISKETSLEGNFLLTGSGTNGISSGMTTIAADEEISVGETIYADGVAVATVNGASDGQGSNDLVLSLTTQATPAIVQNLIRALEYTSSDTGNHMFDLTIEDAALNAGISEVTSFSVTVSNPSTGGGGNGGPVTPPTSWTGSDDTNEVTDFRVPQTLNGGDGEDTLRLNLTSSELTISFDEDGYHFKPAGGETLNVSSIETVQLGDVTLQLDHSEQAKTVMFLYELVFDRGGEPEGLTWWTDTFNAGNSMRDIASSFVQSPEFLETYSTGNSDEDFITALYQNGLQRAPEEAGLASWLEVLAEGTMSRSDIAVFFAESQEINTLFSSGIDDGVYLLV